MKKVFFVFALIAIHLFVFAGEKAAIKGTSNFMIVSMKFKGSYDQIQSNMQDFIKEFFNQGLEPAGPPVGIFHNIPGLVKKSELKWEVGFPVKEDVKVRPPLKFHKLKFRKMISYKHIGPYKTVDESHEYLQKYMKGRGFKAKKNSPIIYRFLNNPPQVDINKLKTEILIPLE